MGTVSGLVTTAQTERIIAGRSSNRPPTSPSSTGLSQRIPVLVNEIEKEKSFKEDAFQAQICLAWLYHTLGEYAHALSTLPPHWDQALERFARDRSITARWTIVCMIKGAYIKGPCIANQVGFIINRCTQGTP